MRSRFFVAVLLCIGLMLTLSACKEEQTVTNEKGEQLVYKDFEISENGFYVHDIKEDTFVPLMSGFSGYDGFPTSSSTQTSSYGSDQSKDMVRSLWISDMDFEPEKLIPSVDNRKTELVLWQKKEEDMPPEYVLEKYRKLGYTLGVHFTFGETGKTLYINNDNRCANSSAEKELKQMSEGLLQISRINKSQDLPLKNIDKQIEMLLGLEKDKKYQLGLFDGTQYRDVDILADTLCFKSEKIITLKSPYNVTERNYFVINLPKNLQNGYYYINDKGMFGYSGQQKKPVAEPSVSETEKDEKADGKAAEKSKEKKEQKEDNDGDQEKGSTRNE